MSGVIGTGMLYGSDFHHRNIESQNEKKKIKEYRTLGRTGYKVSDISFGAGYFSNPNVLAAALDMGINYIDTAEHYTGGQSETAIGQVIKNRDRKSFFLTTKLNFLIRGKKNSTKEKLKERFLKCLERLQTDYVDCFMIHMTPNADQIKDEGFHELAQELKSEGKIRFTGLSNHGIKFSLAGNTEDPMEKVVLAAAEDGRFDVVLMVYNFLQKEQGERIFKACKEKNMGVTLMKMNPVNFYSSIVERFTQMKESGRTIPERYANMLKEFEVWVEQAEAFKKKHGLENETQIRDAAIKYVLSNPDVHAVCASINTFNDLNAYTALSGQKLQSADRSMLNDYDKTLGHLYCRHACGICEPACPHNIPVNTIMRYNHYFETQRREKQAMHKYAGLEKANASICGDCPGPCADACPFNVPIQGLLMLAHYNLTLG